MRADAVDFLCCPDCKSELDLKVHSQDGEEIVKGTLECRGCGERFEIENGLPDLVFPSDLDASTLSTQAFYDQRPLYNGRPTDFRLGIWSSAFRRSRARSMWAEKLAVHEGAHVLEVGVGNGYNLPFISDVIGENGRLAGLDISSNCLRVARERMLGRNIRMELVHGNATYLPYRSDVFDAILSVGGFNNFSDKKRSLEEMHRVAKAGAKLVLQDEGLSPDRERTLLGKYILMCMEDYSSKPPVMHLPGAIEDLKLYWIYQGTAWVIEFRKKG